MRPSLLRAIRLGLLQDLTQKRLRFILNIAIFLSVFAIVSTLISLSIEQKINSNQKKISKNNLLIDIASLSIQSLPRNINSLTTIINDSKKNNEIMFFLYFTKSGIIFDDRDLYYFDISNIRSIGNNARSIMAGSTSICGDSSFIQSYNFWSVFIFIK